MTVEITAHNWIQFCIGRVIAYMAVGIVEPLVPTYQAELSPAPLRGFFAGNSQFVVHFGSIWGSSMSFAYREEQGNKGWIIPVSMQMIPAVLLLVMIPFTIESPRWLITQDRKVGCVPLLLLPSALDCLRE
jgi:MFS transporter, SP family, sugar:H+ symporter